MEFKVGDYVVVSDKPLNKSDLLSNPAYKRPFKVIEAKHSDYAYVKIDDGVEWWWLSERFELDKNTIVTNILKDL